MGGNNMDIKENYKEIIDRNKINFIKVKFDDELIKRITDLTNRVIEAKKGEFHHKVDGNKEFDRFYTGFLGEAAIEQVFGVETIDWSCGNSKKYNVPDLRKIGLEVGVKTSELYNFPIIFKENNYPQIINIRANNCIYICGLATVEVLNKYQDDKLILSPNLRKKGTKTGFYGFDSLISLKGINNINELRQLI